MCAVPELHVPSHGLPACLTLLGRSHAMMQRVTMIHQMQCVTTIMLCVTMVHQTVCDHDSSNAVCDHESSNWICGNIMLCCPAAADAHILNSLYSQNALVALMHTTFDA